MRFCIETLGCKVNQVESSSIAQILKDRGHQETGRGADCDVFIVNTCAVTGDASRQSRQLARRLKREFPHALIALCGCGSQVEPDKLEDTGADIIGGSGQRREFAAAIEKRISERDGSPLVMVDDPRRRQEIEPLPSGESGGRSRAMLKIQDGCDNYCTYCIIPYARGPVRSLDLDSAAEQARELYHKGFREIILTGIEICSYGKDLEKKPSLEDLVIHIGKAVPKARLRLGSLEPSMVTEEFAARLKGVSNFCPHFHMSLQSGSHGILKRMGRKYSPHEFYAAICRLQDNFPDCGITADLIVGFPGETAEEFEETLAFLEKCRFSGLHVFPYSKRPGTAAAKMPEQIQNAVKKERAALARNVGERTREEFIKNQIGTTHSIIIEHIEDGFISGHSGNYLEIKVGTEDRDDFTRVRGEMVDIVITGYEKGIVWGDLLK